jgi:hypothetical protein
MHPSQDMLMLRVTVFDLDRGEARATSEAGAPFGRPRRPALRALWTASYINRRLIDATNLHRDTLT